MLFFLICLLQSSAIQVVAGLVTLANVANLSAVQYAGHRNLLHVFFHKQETIKTVDADETQIPDETNSVTVLANTPCSR